MKKTVWISGSPHRNGNSAKMAQQLCRALDAEVRRFDMYTENIRPCVDCGHCTDAPGCCMADGAGELLRAIGDADCIVLSAPVYFSDLPGPVISAASRLQYLWMRRRAGEEVLPAKERIGVILLSGGGTGKPDRALANARCYLHMLGARIVGEITSLHTDTLPPSEDADACPAIAETAVEIRQIWEEI